ncbi:hypothetical protein HanPSC8_Chr02g0070901 [Helianthus annuus]|nr:hypothetical protein HanPSC8_Chr02g0070901 [Helianthus annuus]
MHHFHANMFLGPCNTISRDLKGFARCLFYFCFCEQSVRDGTTEDALNHIDAGKMFFLVFQFLVVDQLFALIHYILT